MKYTHVVTEGSSGYLLQLRQLLSHVAVGGDFLMRKLFSSILKGQALVRLCEANSSLPLYLHCDHASGSHYHFLPALILQVPTRYPSLYICPQVNPLFMIQNYFLDI